MGGHLPVDVDRVLNGLRVVGVTRRGSTEDHKWNFHDLDFSGFLLLPGGHMETLGLPFSGTLFVVGACCEIDSSIGELLLPEEGYADTQVTCTNNFQVVAHSRH